MTDGGRDTPGAVEVAGRATGERRWRLEDERDFLRRSLADLAAERDAGDIDRADYDGLLARDRRRLAAVESELAQLEAASAREAAAAVGGATASGEGESTENREKTQQPEKTDEPSKSARGKTTPKRRRPRWLAIVAAVALSAGATLLVVDLASPRLPGQPETGTVAQSAAERIVTQLNQATVLVNEGTSSSLSQALTLYEAILVEDPRQPQALAEFGYLEWEAGLARSDTALEKQGRASVERSLSVESDDSAAHLFLGTIDLEGAHEPTAAVTQYRLFLAEHPPAAEVAKAAPLLRQAFAEASESLPAGVPAA
jgi:hypothetical protein